jgi:ABC-type glutathione transport system ATPase component
MAISIEPQLIIADEITTALDANLKIEILNLLNRLRLRVKTSILFITHDLILAKKYCDRISVLKEGSIVEINTAKKLFKFPEHPYTKTLVRGIKSNALETNKKNNYKNKPLALEVKKVKKSYGSTQVLDNISVSLLKNSTFGIIGESGSGKSTLVKIILNILKRDSGSVNLINKNLEKKLLTRPNRQVSAVFQDSLSSLNPKMTIRQILFEPLNILKIKNKDSIVLDILNRVDLKEALLNRFPNQISGGQRQRVSIARAIITKPKILILDEPTSSLDSDIQEKIIQLILKVKEENNLSLLFISHDLAVINKVSDYIGVMHKGKIIEQGLKFDILKNPKRDYTKKLIRSVYDVNF